MSVVDELLDVTQVEVVGDHRLRLTFEDGLAGDMDFTGHRWHGVSEPLADSVFFAKARLDPEIGTVAWPNNYDIAPETLYERAARYPVHSPASGAVAQASQGSVSISRGLHRPAPAAATSAALTRARSSASVTYGGIV